MAKPLWAAQALAAAVSVLCLLLRPCSAKSTEQVPLAADGQERGHETAVAPLKRVALFRREERRQQERLQTEAEEKHELLRILSHGRPAPFESSSRTNETTRGAAAPAAEAAKPVTLEDVLTMEDHLMNHPPLSEGGEASVADENFKTTSLEAFGMEETTTPEPARCLPPRPSVTMGFYAVNLQPYLDCLGAYCDDASDDFLDHLLGTERDSTGDENSENATSSLGGCPGILARRNRSCGFDLSLAYPVPDGTLLGFLCGKSCPDVCSHAMLYRSRLLSRGKQPMTAAREMLVAQR